MSPYKMDLITFFVADSPEVKVLRDIALNGSSTKYSVEKRLKSTKYKLSHGTVYKGFAKLIEKEYIREVSRKRGRNPNIETVTYNITFKGLSMVFHHIDPDDILREYGEKILPERHSSLLPLVFGKWNQFKEKGLQVFFKDRIQSAFNGFRTKEEINYEFYLGELPTDEETLNKWKEVLRDDPDINDYVSKRLRSEIKELEEDRNSKQDFLQFLTAN